MDVMTSGMTAAADAIAILAGFLTATWIRFYSGMFPVDSWPPNLNFMYGWGAVTATIIFLLLFRQLGLYIRPQLGGFSSKIPRLIRATALGILLATALAFAVQHDPPYSRLTVLLSFPLICLNVVLERYLLFRFEIHLARKTDRANRVIIVGTEEVAAHLQRSLENEPRLRSKVIGFIQSTSNIQPVAVPQAMILGNMDQLEPLLDSTPPDQLIVTDSQLDHHRLVEIILACERNMVTFNMVPDMFRIMTGSMDMRVVDDIPLLGISRWPLDYFWNRVLKRTEDIVGSAIGLFLIAPLMAVAAILIKRSSPGPAFYEQERCGENGESFTIYKLRTMRMDAESQTGPVWAIPDDPRRTPLGTFLRKYNIDELPQLWNVLIGNMSLIGPRPERPHFVEKFKDDISRYMWRHVSKPGMTGWAQVNGLRGNTSIEERIKYDLYYLENWSLAFDFKILLRTFTSNKNAY
jgi:exopolysaccharide biosynthesis polyprenyl glycosylphosphotransferase